MGTEKLYDIIQHASEAACVSPDVKTVGSNSGAEPAVLVHAVLPRLSIQHRCMHKVCLLEEEALALALHQWMLWWDTQSLTTWQSQHQCPQRWATPQRSRRLRQVQVCIGRPYRASGLHVICVTRSYGCLTMDLSLSSLITASQPIHATV